MPIATPSAEIPSSPALPLLSGVFLTGQSMVCQTSVYVATAVGLGAPFT